MDMPSASTITAAVTLLGGLWAYFKGHDTKALKERAEGLVWSAIEHELESLEHDPDRANLGRARAMFTTYAQTVLSNAGIPLKLVKPIVDAAVERGIIALKTLLNREARARLRHEMAVQADRAAEVLEKFKPSRTYEALGEIVTDPDPATPPPSDNGASSEAPPATLLSGTPVRG